jgi:citrate lyase subunit beta/citryl-CoA lyase
MKKKKKSSAGLRGEIVRSDCYVELEVKESGGIKLNLQSKVESMYGESIRKLILDMCRFFSLKNAKVTVEDYGASPLIKKIDLQNH